MQDAVGALGKHHHWVCSRNWRRQRCQPMCLPAVASRSYGRRYAVARATSSRVKTTRTRTAHSFFCGGWLSSYGC
jgi:hypothetical protein